jgi:hypothetical protein
MAAMNNMSRYELLCKYIGRAGQADAKLVLQD